MVAGGWGEERFIPRGWSTVKNKKKGGGKGMKIKMKSFLLSPAPTPTVHSNCKSKMAGRTNDRELLALARTNKTPALQATLIRKRTTSSKTSRQSRRFKPYNVNSRPLSLLKDNQCRPDINLHIISAWDGLLLFYYF